MERPQIPNLRIGHNFQSVRMEHTRQRLIQFVELVQGRLYANIPQHTVGQDQLIGRTECGPIFRVLIEDLRFEGGDFLAAPQIVNGRQFTLCAQQSILTDVTELHVLLLVPLPFHCKLLVLDVPQSRQWRSPRARRQYQVAVAIALNVIDVRVVTVERVLFGALVDVEDANLAAVRTDDQRTGAWREIAGSKEAIGLGWCAQRARHTKVRMHQTTVEPTRCDAALSPEIATGKVETVTGDFVGPRIGTLVRHEQIELRTRGHWMLAEGMLIGQVFGDDGIE